MISKKKKAVEALTWMLTDIGDNRHFQIEYYPKVISEALEYIMSQPEVIRCKDCKHYDSMTESCLNGLDGIFMPDWFCPEGKRRDDDA